MILNLLTHSVRSRVKANVHTYSDGQIIKRIQYFVVLVIRFALHDLVIFFSDMLWEKGALRAKIEK